MEEEHSVPVRPGDDPCPGVALADGAVAARRHAARGQGLLRAQVPHLLTSLPTSTHVQAVFDLSLFPPPG